MGTVESNTKWSKYEKFVSDLGNWAWIIGIISGILNIIWGIWGAIAVGTFRVRTGPYVFLIIGGIIAVLISFVIIKPNFSDKCAERDWDFLLNWIIEIGSFRFPWMLFWGIMLQILTWWGGLPVLIPALFLIFTGPKEYKWSTK
ncbi:MAG: hypothetical protein ACFFA0_02870 [Promethearchaeota archaeon]